jgi:site-specific DNA recombinase
MNGSCANSRTISRTALEERVLAGLRDRLMAPDVAAEAMRAYAEETNRLNAERRATLAADHAELAAIPQKITEIITMIEEGGGTRAMVDQLRELEAREDELNERLAQAPADIPDLHPNFAGICHQKVERLTEALERPEERDEAAAAIRDIIERITLSPGPGRGKIDATLHGDFRMILEWTHRRRTPLQVPFALLAAPFLPNAQSFRSILHAP